MISIRHILILGSAVALAIWSILHFWSSFGPREPTYHGRQLNAWISDLASEVSLAQQTKRAEDAIRQIGTNGLSRILDELRVPDDSALVKAAHEKFSSSPLARKELAIRLPHRKAAIRRMQAGHALRVLAQPLGLNTLTNLLNDSNPHVQRAVALALVTGFTIEGVEALMDALESESVQVRLAALHGLHEAGYIPQKIAPLIKCLADRSPEVRRSAASCLRQFSPVYRDKEIPGLIEGLETAAQDPEPSVHALARQALAGIRPRVASEIGSSK